MLTFEIRINGSIIGAISAINRGPVAEGGVCRYEYQGVTFPIDNTGPVHTVHGFIEHRRSDGAAALVARLAEAASKAIGVSASMHCPSK
jgi:hypothetical protein